VCSVRRACRRADGQVRWLESKTQNGRPKQDLIDDLVAEQNELDRAVRDAPARSWEALSPAEGWQMRDCIAHLMDFDETAATIALGEPFPRPSGSRPANATLSARQDGARSLTIAELLAAWRQARARLEAALRPLDPKARLPWAGPPMSARSFTTARLMECWSHGLDALETAGVEPQDTDRLRHIAQLGYMTREFSYRTRAMEPSTAPLRVELEAPSGAVWTWGPEEAADRITGSAGDFCRVVTQRINYLDTALARQGAAAEEFLRIAQAFAGPPGAGRPAKGSG
jgi:uncharacterized protein (TIGR03084 family)